MISNSDNKDIYLLELVQNLVKECIKAEDCINVLTIPITHDPATLRASRLIKDLKAQNRTIKCLTKPDRIQKGESVNEWLDILNNEAYHLKFDYHVIKNNPNTRVDYTTARFEERIFFREEEPWTTTLSAHSHRFGTSQERLRLMTERALEQSPESLFVA